MSEKIPHPRLAYASGEQVCDFMADRQIIYQNKDHALVLLMANGKYTHKDFHLKGTRIIGRSLIEQYDVEKNILYGMFYRVKRENELIAKYKFQVDLKNKIKTVFRDTEGKSISEISKLDPVDFSIAETCKYNTVGNLISVEPCKKNLKHGNCLYYYNNTKKNPPGQISNVKNRLQTFKRYKDGFLLDELNYDLESNLTDKFKGDKISPQNDLFEDHSYEDGKHVVRYYANGLLYEEDVLEWDLLLSRAVFDDNQCPVFIELNEYRPSVYIVMNGTELRDYELAKTTQYYPEKWNENSESVSGTMKEIVDDCITESGPFINIDGQFQNDGTHLFAKGLVQVYENGKILEERKQDVFEQNGDLVLREENNKQHDNQQQFKLG